jgi:hypothetical protein
LNGYSKAGGVLPYDEGIKLAKIILKNYASHDRQQGIEKNNMYKRP